MSTTVQVTEVVPSGKALPAAGVHVSEATPLGADTVGGGKFTSAPQTPAGDVGTLKLPGHMMVGGAASITVTTTSSSAWSRRLFSRMSLISYTPGGRETETTGSVVSASTVSPSTQM